MDSGETFCSTGLPCCTVFGPQPGIAGCLGVPPFYALLLEGAGVLPFDPVVCLRLQQAYVLLAFGLCGLS